MTAPRSSLVFLIPEADPVVRQHRLAHDPAARAGLDAHITLLFPFVSPSRIDDGVLARLADQFARDRVISGAVDLIFDRPARFPGGVTYLALADAMPVTSKILALAAAWPEYPRYEGRFPDSVPHVTVAHGADDVLDAVDAELVRALPVVARVESAWLIVETATGQWEPHTRFGLA